MMLASAGHASAAYIMEPIVSTLVRGALDVLGTSWDVRKLAMTEATAHNDSSFAGLQWPDVFICVNARACFSAIPWTSLRRRGVLTVLFNTEPLHACATDVMKILRPRGFGEEDPDEIWDYSWHNIDTCAQRLGPNGSNALPLQPSWALDTTAVVGTRAYRLRYVPPGALPDSPRVREEQADRGQPRELVFLGGPNFRNGSCWRLLGMQLATHSAATSRAPTAAVASQPPVHVIGHGISSHEQFAAMLARHAKDIFLNVHKSAPQPFSTGPQRKLPPPWQAFCGDKHNPIASSRIAKLVTARALVISESAFTRDEAELAGAASFVPFAEVGAEFARLRQLSSEERRDLARARAEWFEKRFQPGAILRRAGIVDELRRREMRATSSPPSG